MVGSKKVRSASVGCWRYTLCVAGGVVVVGDGEYITVCRPVTVDRR